MPPEVAFAKEVQSTNQSTIDCTPEPSPPQITPSHMRQLPAALAANLWQPGQSGNPKGRTPKRYDLAALCKEQTEAAVNRLVEIMLDPSDPRSSVVAAVALLDRAHGKPREVAVAQETIVSGWEALTLHARAEILRAQRGLSKHAIASGTKAPVVENVAAPSKAQDADGK